MDYPEDFTFEEYSRKPICGVLSVAILAGVSFAEATKAIKANMLPHQKRHGGKTYHAQRMGALSSLGVFFRERKVSSRMTLHRWVVNYCEPGKRYMITTSSHVVTVDEHWNVYDQVEVAYVGDHGSRRCFVREVLEIVNA